MSEVFKELYAIDVSDKAEKKKGLAYLSWAWAWAEVKKRYPDATYTIKKFENNLPYVYDEQTGYMVFTEVVLGEQLHEMWLPVMDHNNMAMKSTSYQVKQKNRTVTVATATMFDINKTIMRCLTKNLAMFGLGLYIFAGEDIPEQPEIVIELINKQDIDIINQKVDRLADLTDGDPEENKAKLTTWIHGQAKVTSLEEIEKDFLNDLLDLLDRMIAKNTPEETNEQESLLEGNSTKPKAE